MASVWYIGSSAVARFIGALGTFFAGSCTVSNILFVQLQFDTAAMLQLPEYIIVALQNIGGIENETDGNSAGAVLFLLLPALFGRGRQFGHCRKKCCADGHDHGHDSLRAKRP